MSFMLLGILNSQVSGGGAGAFDLLETTTLTSSASSVTFSGLDAYSDYKHLQIRAVVRDAHPATGSSYLSMQFNSDTATNYDSHFLYGDGSSVQSSSATSVTYMRFFGNLPFDSNPTGAYGASVIDILDYANAKNKTVKVIGGSPLTGADSKVSLSSGLWRSTSAVTSITMIPWVSLFATGSRFSLYGVK